MTTSNRISAETIERTKKRVEKLSDRELLDWCEVALPGMMRHLEAYRRSGDDAHLMELGFAETTLNLALNEVFTRHAARRDEGLTPG